MHFRNFYGFCEAKGRRIIGDRNLNIETSHRSFTKAITACAFLCIFQILKESLVDVFYAVLF